MTEIQTSNEVQTLIELLHLQKAKIRGHQLWGLCLNPYHDDTNPTNFNISLETGNCFCFACLYKNNIVNLLWDNTGSYNQSILLWNKLRSEFYRRPSLYIPEQPLPLSYVNLYKRNGLSKYALKRIPDEQQLLKYGIYADTEDNPIFFVKDWQGLERAVWVRDNGQYMLIHPEGSKKDGWLFGMDITPTEITILTEGFFDACYVNWKTGLKAVAGMGTYLSPKQLDNLGKMGKIVVMFDGDIRGRKAREFLHKKTRHLNIWFAGKYILDPDELSVQELSSIIQNAKSWDEFGEYIKWNDRINNLQLDKGCK